jgi:hypothetical protein
MSLDTVPDGSGADFGCAKTAVLAANNTDDNFSVA